VNDEETAFAVKLIAENRKKTLLFSKKTGFDNDPLQSAERKPSALHLVSML
jgi:hypothetical protein